MPGRDQLLYADHRKDLKRLTAFLTGRNDSNLLIEEAVSELEAYKGLARRDFLADIRNTVPFQDLVLARAQISCPSKSLIVCSQPETYADFDSGLSPAVTVAMEPAVHQIRTLLAEFFVGDVT